MTFQLKADPTFKAKVKIHRPGDEPAEVEFAFKHRPRLQMAEWLAKLDGQKAVKDFAKALDMDAAAVMDCAVGWELTDEFTQKNVRLLLDQYPTSASAIIAVYIREVGNARRGN